MDIIKLAFFAFIIENIVLYRFMGVSSIINSTKKKFSTLIVAGVLLFIMIITSVSSLAIYRYLLKPLKLEYFCILLAIMIIIILTVVILFIIRKISLAFFDLVKEIIPVATVNSSVFGTMYIVIHSDYAMIEALVFSLFTGLGYILVSIILAKLREKIDHSPVPEGFKGVPIMLITAAALAVIFARLTGII